MYRSRNLTLTLSAIVLLAALATPLPAQAPASTFEELRTTLRLNDKEPVEIIDTAGAKHKGTVTALSGMTLSTVVNGTPRDFLQSQVREIRQVRRDSLVNGALVGLLGGIGAGAIAVRASCGPNDSECAAIASLVFIPTFAAGGIGLGMLTDGLIKKHETVFAGSSAASRGFHIAPILGKKTAGVSVSFGF
jgi:hypothetical protein